MTHTLNLFTPAIALLFLTASIVLASQRNGYPLIMRLWFYHVTLYWCTNSVIVFIFGHYLNPQLINMWSSAIAVQAAASVLLSIYAKYRWKSDRNYTAVEMIDEAEDVLDGN